MAVKRDNALVVRQVPSSRRVDLSLVLGAATILLIVSSKGIARDFFDRAETTLDDRQEIRYVYVNRNGRDDGAGGVLQFSPGFSLTRNRARASTSIRYRADLSWGLSDIDPETLTHDLTAESNIEAIEDLLYVDVTAGARVVGDSTTSGTVDAINLGSDGTQSYSFQVSPSFRPRTDNRYVRFESNNSVNLVDYTGGSDRSNNSGSNATRLNARLVSGPFFTTFDWDIDATQTTTDFDDRDDTRRSYSAGIGYNVSPRLRFNGRAGYEDNDVDTRRSDTEGVFWDVGADWRPSRRTSVSVNYGNRYFGETYSGRISHRSRRITLSLDASHDVTNRRTSRLVDDFFFLVDPNGNLLLDPITGQPIVVNIPNIEQTDEDFLRTRIRAGILISGRRTSISLSADTENRKFEVSGDDEDTYGLSASVSRRLASDLSASLNGRYEQSENSANEDSDFYRVGLFVNKTLTSRSSLRFELSYRERDSDRPNDDYDEIRAGITLATSFFD